MEVILTKQLLGALIKGGYPYFLCRTSSTVDSGPVIRITLKPVKMHPLLHLLPAPYQRYYKISQELLQMAEGLPGARILVDLNGVRLGAQNKGFALVKAYLNTI